MLGDYEEFGDMGVLGEYLGAFGALPTKPGRPGQQVKAPIAEMDAIEKLVKAVGAERVLFGTDNSDLSFCRGKILGADLVDEQRDAIFYRNAMALLRTRA